MKLRNEIFHDRNGFIKGELTVNAGSTGTVVMKLF